MPNSRGREAGNININCVISAEDCRRNNEAAAGDLPNSDESESGDLQVSCNFCEFDDELVQDILGRMILHWNYRNLKEIPQEVLENGEHIQEIYLKRNCLERLPSNIGKLCNLTNLYLVGNQLEELPNEIGSLSALKVLDLSQNYIKKLPQSLGELKQLESLLLTYNQLEELPKCLKNLHRLKQLELSGNRIYFLPEEIIQGLESLEELGIDRNPISFLPRNICLLKKLYYFSACRCNLLFLPSLPFHLILHRGVGDIRNGAYGTPFSVQFLFDGNPRLNYIPYWVLQLLGTNVECFGCGLELEPAEGATTSTQLLLYSYNDAQRPKIKLTFKGKRRILYFDQDLTRLHHRSAQVPSLLELCLRQIYRLDILEDCINNPKGSPRRKQSVKEALIIPQKAGQPKRIEISSAAEIQTQSTSRQSHGTASQEARNDLSAATEATTAASPLNLDLNLILPQNLIGMLSRGPVAKCFECMKPIFTESWPLIFSIPRRIMEENNERRINQAAGEEEQDNLILEERRREETSERMPFGCAQFCSDFCIVKFRRDQTDGGRGGGRSNLLMNDLKVLVQKEIEWEAMIAE